MGADSSRAFLSGRVLSAFTFLASGAALRTSPWAWTPAEGTRSGAVTLAVAGVDAGSEVAAGSVVAVGLVIAVGSVAFASSGAVTMVLPMELPPTTGGN